MHHITRSTTVLGSYSSFSYCTIRENKLAETMVAEDHYLTLNDLTSHHKNKIAELRRRAADDLATYPEYGSDFQLLRWLMGWDYNIGLLQ